MCPKLVSSNSSSNWFELITITINPLVGAVRPLTDPQTLKIKCSILNLKPKPHNRDKINCSEDQRLITGKLFDHPKHFSAVARCNDPMCSNN